MERQLANLTGLVQKALTHTPAPHPSPSPRDYLQVPAGRDPYARSAGKTIFIQSCDFLGKHFIRLSHLKVPRGLSMIFNRQIRRIAIAK